jgi:hypothetical protein
MMKFFKGLYFILYMICICFFVKDCMEYSITAIIWITLAMFNLIKYIKIKV